MVGIAGKCHSHFAKVTSNDVPSSQPNGPPVVLQTAECSQILLSALSGDYDAVCDLLSQPDRRGIAQVLCFFLQPFL